MGKVEPIHHSIPAKQVGELSKIRGKVPSRLFCPAQRLFHSGLGS
jgi:hypothetical protein